MHVRGLMLGASLTFVLSCSRGSQTLYIASDRPEALTVTINGTKQSQTTQGFQAYYDVKLTKGAEVVVESGALEVEHVTLKAVDEGDAALFLVGGAPTLALADYTGLAGVVDRKGQGGFTNSPGWGPVTRGELKIVDVDRTSKTKTFDRRTVIAGPGAPMPKGGEVNQFTMEKFPIYRLERVPAGSDPFETISVRTTRELGRDHLPGQPPNRVAP